MYSFLNPRAWSMQAGIQLYNTPLLLADALGKLERLADKHNSGSKRNKRAGSGCVIDLLDLTDQSLASFQLVMPNEASPENNQISVLSPLGSSLLNLKRGDISRVDLWGSSYQFQVLDIRYTDPVPTNKE
jgi:transcription elongation GreA/GreB family factor